MSGSVDAVNMSQERVDETAKREHEPVAWMSENGVVHNVKHGDVLTPLYKKHEWVGLTDEELLYLLPNGEWQIDATLYFARAIEAKLKEKNG